MIAQLWRQRLLLANKLPRMRRPSTAILLGRPALSTTPRLSAAVGGTTHGCMAAAHDKKRKALSTATLGSNFSSVASDCASSSSSSSSLLLLDHWNQMVQDNELQPDAQQARAAKKLQKLQVALQGYDNGPLIEHYEKRAALRKKRQEEEEKRKQQKVNESNDIEQQVSHEKESSNPVVAIESPEEPEPPRLRVPRGMYLYGSVGTGKSLLMDTFFQLVPVARKRRCHFHAFMSDVHDRIHRLKQQDLLLNGRNFHIDTNEYRNPIHRVGRQIAGETALLCFDEFQVTDVADALILSQLFAVLFALGTVVVSTSNRPPQDLYEGGVNRYYFLPFIDLLQKHCVTHDIASNTDYRRETSINFPSYYFIAGGDDDKDKATGDGVIHRAQIDALVNEMRGDTPSSAGELSLGQSRSLLLKDMDERGKLVRVSFDELCDTELGATDYRRLAYQFQIIVIEDIPLLTTEQHDLARRFITLVDELYEGRCAVVCVASDKSATDPSLLFSKLTTTTTTPSSSNHPNGSGEIVLGIDQASTKGGHPIGALASVRELDFAFARAASRLTEMTSLPWWDRVLRPV